MQAVGTVAEVLRPRDQVRAVAYDAGSIVAGSFLMALAAQVALGYPVPATAQTFAVLLVGAVLGPWRGGLCAIVYLAEGLAGLPVFAQGKTGPAALIGPTGGYLIGFVFACYTVGWLAEQGWDRRFWTTVAAMLAGNVVIYVFGLGRLWVLMGWRQALAVGLYPFVLADVMKILLAAVTLPSVWRLLARWESDK